MNPDVIVSWPVNCDYPLWRKMIKNEEQRFNDIIIVLTQTNCGYDYSDFIIKDLGSFARIVNSPTLLAGEDWRNVAVNYGLSLSTSNFVLFTEQDFYPKESLWKYLETPKPVCADAIAVYQGERLHPCFILCPRILIEQTRKDFGIIPSVADHFYKFQEDLKGKNILRISQENYEHLNGLSSNFTLISRGEKPNYQPERFKKYIEDCLSCGVELEPEFVRVCKTFLQK